MDQESNRLGQSIYSRIAVFVSLVPQPTQQKMTRTYECLEASKYWVLASKLGHAARTSSPWVTFANVPFGITFDKLSHSCLKRLPANSRIEVSFSRDPIVR
jgi:hypothetical protein